jgi:hypothetical protein
MAWNDYDLSDIFNKETAFDAGLTTLFGTIAVYDAAQFVQTFNPMTAVFGTLMGVFAARHANEWKRKVTGTGFW